MTEVYGINVHIFLCFYFQVEGLIKVFLLELGKRDLCNDFMGDLHVVVSFFPPGQSNPISVQAHTEARADFLELG